MRCSRVQYLYEDYVAGVVALETAARIDEHLAGCALCRDFYESNDDISQLISHCDEVVHPGDPYLDTLSSRVMNDLFDESGEFKKVNIEPVASPRGKRWRSPLWVTGGVAAAALFALGLGPYLSKGASSFSLRSLAVDLGIFAPGPKRSIASSNASPLRQVANADLASDDSPDSELRPQLFSEEDSDLRGANLGGDSARMTASSSRSYPLSPLATQGGIVQQDISKSAKRAMEETQSGDGGGMTRKVAMGPPYSNREFSPSPSSAHRPPRVEVQIGSSSDPDFLGRLMEQLVVMGNMETAEARQQIIDMIQKMSESSAAASGSSPAATLGRQVQHFRQAQIEYKAGRFERAIQQYNNVYELDPTTVLACRAAMSVADLDYYEFGDFAEAQRYYERCKKSAFAQGLSASEVAHVNKQSETLVRYAAGDWTSLKALYSIGREPWDKVAETLRRIAGDANLHDLMPEAVRSAVERFQEGEGAPGVERPGDRLVLDMIDLIEKAIPAQQTTESKAWLQLAAGDLIWVRFKNAAPAMQAFEKTLAIDENSVPGQIAAKRIGQIREANLGGFVR